MNSPTPTVPVRRAALAFIFVTVLIDILSFGVIIPVLPQLIKRMAGGEFVDATTWVGLIQTTFAIVQFFATPVQGALSDRFGRRPVILASNLGVGLDFILMATVNTLPWLMVARVISGLTSASFTAANAYIADVVPPEKRAASFGMLGAAFGIGFVIGPALGGTLGHIDIRLPFWVSAGLALTNFCYGLFVLPESLPPERRTKTIDWKRANPVGALVMLRRYPQVLGIATIIFLSSLAHYVLNSMFALYADYRYDWKEREVGYVLCLVGICNIIVQAGLVGRLVRQFGERRMLFVGLMCGATGFAIQGLAPTGWWFLSAVPFLALWGFANPSMQAIMTRQVDPHEQGRLQGAVSSLASLAGIFGPGLHTQVFAYFIGANAIWHLPGAPFLLSSLLLLIGIVMAMRILAHTPVAIGAPAATSEPANDTAAS